MSILGRLFGIGKRESHTVRGAREREQQGDLGGAVQLFLEAGLGDEAARVLLLRADAETSVERRIAFCAQAAARAATEEIRRRALGRKALCVFDTLKNSGTSFLQSEVLVVARELEEAGELERAADAYAMAGDAESEVRALTAAGAIDRLEERLRATEAATRSQRDIEQRVRRFSDLDRTAERRLALELAAQLPADPRLDDLARALRAKLARGPIVELAIDGATQRYVLGEEVTVGRADATITVSSPAISRLHIRVFRGPDGPAVEDMGTRNGTWLAGARLGASLPIGAGLELTLGNEIPCTIRPSPSGAVEIEVAGTTHLAPLGPLVIPGTGGRWRIARAARGSVDGKAAPVGSRESRSANASSGEELVTLLTDGASVRPVLGDFAVADQIELAHGDEIREGRGGAVRVRVPAPTGSPGGVPPPRRDGEPSTGAREEPRALASA